MNKKLIYITEGITFDDLECNRYSPIEIYKKQIENSILKPVSVLEQSTVGSTLNFSAMAALSTLLLFFENHGRYLKGYIGRGDSRKNFEFGFERLLEYTSSENVGEYSSDIDFYGGSRCGLYHRFRLDDKLLVSSISKQNSIFYKFGAVEQVMICPWQLSDCIYSYMQQYCNEIELDMDSVLGRNFTRVFDNDIRGFLSGLAGSSN